MKAVVMVGLILCAVPLSGCLNLGGGRQMVTLPWSYPAVAMDASGSQLKNGQAAGAQGLTTAASAVYPTGDQVMWTGANLSNHRSTDSALADDQGAAGGGGAGSGVLSGNPVADRRVTPTVNIGPAGGAQLGPGTGGGAAPAAVVDPATLTDDQAAALLKRLQAAQAKADAAAGK